MCVYLSNGLRGLGLEVVSTHEVGHCAMYSYGLLDPLHAANTALGRNVPVIK